MPRPHLSNPMRYFPRALKNSCPTSPVFPSRPASWSFNSFRAKVLLLWISALASWEGNRYPNNATRFHGLWDRKEVYCLKRPSSIRFAVAKPSRTPPASPPRSRKARMAANAAGFCSIEVCLSACRKGMGPVDANSINLLPFHLQVDDPVSFFNLSLSWTKPWLKLRCEIWNLTDVG